ncbi:hypothetical protein NP493_80g03010 [Ridgeia piscesae]|uniref:Uncharacterized protein n=1 Tax=Ridgeia piscesae TaxID=27915 RepID=A0AAD9P907_RIDPI|nr:hypothetical protein NP493_80g03010 [Ridgeia piscesae]
MKPVFPCLLCLLLVAGHLDALVPELKAYKECMSSCFRQYNECTNDCKASSVMIANFSMKSVCRRLHQTCTRSCHKRHFN